MTSKQRPSLWSIMLDIMLDIIMLDINFKMPVQVRINYLHEMSLKTIILTLTSPQNGETLNYFTVVFDGRVDYYVLLSKINKVEILMELEEDMPIPRTPICTQ